MLGFAISERDQTCTVFCRIFPQNTALHLACQANHASAASLLLSMNCALAANGSGHTALDICFKHKLTETARVLLTSGTAG